MKYKLTKKTKNIDGKTLYRTQALEAIPSKNVKKGSLGGWLQSEKSLSQKGTCWVSGDAYVFGNAQVFGNARVCDNAQVFGDARVYGDAQVYGNAWVFGDAQVDGNAQVYGNAWVSGKAWVFGDARVYGDAQVYGNARVCGNAHVCDNAQIGVIEIKDITVDFNWDEAIKEIMENKNILPLLINMPNAGKLAAAILKK